MWFALLVLFIVGLAGEAKSQSPNATLSNGLVVIGKKYQPDSLVQPVNAFLGIPYAQVSERFGSPVSKMWTLADHTFNATQYGYYCWQPNVPAQFLSEDCLTLNIMTPLSPPQAELRPVMVWIHGGRSLSGSGSLYDGSSLVATTDTVYVSINYRLGAFGFLHTPSTTGNQGLEDQVAALEWVHREIKNFGGDPAKVTLAGQSAGASNVLAHMASPVSAGLFRAAILLSPALTTLWAAEQSLDRYNDVLTRTSCDGQADPLACLRQLPAQELATAGNDEYWLARVDGNILLQQPLDALRDGKFNRVPIIVGTTQNEYSFNICNGQPNQTISIDQYRAQITRVMTQYVGANDLSRVVERVLLKYPPKYYENNPLYSLIDALTAFFFTCPIKHLADNVANYKSVFLYNLEKAPGFADNCTKASHGNDLVYLFPNVLNLYAPGYSLSLQEKNIAYFLKQSIGQFMYSGTPDYDYDKFEWANLKEDRTLYTKLNTPWIEIGCNLRAEECAFWDKIVPLSGLEGKKN